MKLVFWRGFAHQSGKWYGFWHTFGNPIPSYNDVFEIWQRFLAHYKLKQWQKFTLDQNGFGFRVFKLIADLALFVRGIHRADYYSDGGSSNEGDGVFWSVECEQAKTIALCKSQVVQAVCDAIDHRDNFTIGQDEVVVDNRRAVGIAISGHAQKVIIWDVRKVNGWAK